MNNKPVDMLRNLPSVEEIIQNDQLSGLFTKYPRNIIVNTVRSVLQNNRQHILNGNCTAMTKEELREKILLEVKIKIAKSSNAKLRRVINATGVIIHTNLGRSLLSESSIRAVNKAASGFINVELNLNSGKRGSRYSPLENLIIELTGAESALVVNNNAAAVLLALGTLAKNKEVIISRGQLVEIGGSFRIPDVMVQSGALMVEVGTTNKTHPEDYKRAINDNTALILNVHTSNYRIVGFTRETSIEELALIGREANIPVMSDLGSGSLIDLRSFNLPYEPTAGEVLRAGADVVTFSGDKLLGGPQAGIIAGKRELIEKMKKNPLTRAIRIDKFTVAALEATLMEYRNSNEVISKIPTLNMLSITKTDLYPVARTLKDRLTNLKLPGINFNLIETVSRVGGGSLPTAELPSLAIEICLENEEISALATRLRLGSPAVMGRIQDGKLILDMRTVQPDEIDTLFEAIKNSYLPDRKD